MCYLVILVNLTSKLDPFQFFFVFVVFSPKAGKLIIVDPISLPEEVDEYVIRRCFHFEVRGHFISQPSLSGESECVDKAHMVTLQEPIMTSYGQLVRGHYDLIWSTSESPL